MAWPEALSRIKRRTGTKSQFPGLSSVCFLFVPQVPGLAQTQGRKRITCLPAQVWDVPFLGLLAQRRRNQIQMLKEVVSCSLDLVLVRTPQSCNIIQLILSPLVV